MRSNPRLAAFRASVPPEYRTRRLVGLPPRAAASIAVAGLLVGLVLTPFMATIGICRPSCGGWFDEPLVVRTLGRWITERGWLSGPSDDALYFGFGRWFFLVYVGILVAVASVRSGTRVPITGRSTGRYAHGLLVGSLALACFGDVMSYGAGVFWRFAWSAGFALEVLAWLGVVVGSVGYGIALVRSASVPAWVGWAVLAGGVAIPVGFFDRALVQYMPNAQILPLAAIWGVLACWRARLAARGTSAT